MRAYTLTFVNACSHHHTMITLPILLGTADLATRWGYTRQGVHQLTTRRDFPAPATAVNSGRVRIWLLADVEAYERGRPEFKSEAAKRRKQTGYHLARLKG